MLLSSRGMSDRMKVSLVCNKCSNNFVKEINRVRPKIKPKRLLAFCPNCKATRICSTKRTDYWSKTKYPLLISLVVVGAILAYHFIQTQARVPHPADVECTNCHHSLYDTVGERIAVRKIGEAHHIIVDDPSKILESRPYPEEINCSNCHTDEVDFEKLHHSIIGYKAKGPSDEICTFCHTDVIEPEIIPISKSTCNYCHTEFPWYFRKMMNVSFDFSTRETILTLKEIAIKRKRFLRF